MKRFALLGALLAAGPAFAQVDFSVYTISLAVEQADLDSASGLSGSNPWAMAFHPNGDLIIFNDPAGNPGGLMRINPDTKVGSLIRSEADIIADFSGTQTDIDNDYLVVADANTIYFNEHDGGNPANQVIKVDISGTPVASRVVQEEGNNGMALLPSGNLALSLIQNFGGAGNNVGVVDVTAMTYTTKVTQADIIAVTGGAAANVPLLAWNPATSAVLVWDEAAFGGSDSLLSIANLEGTPVITEVTPSNWDNGGLSSMTVDADGNIYAFNEFDADAGEVGINVWNGTTMAVVPRADITAAAGPGNFDTNAPGGIAVRRPNSTQAELFLADTFGSSGIVKITFGNPPTEVRDWSLY